MLYYQLDASQDPDRSAFLKTLSDKYGKPDSAYPSFENPSFYGWNLDNDVSFDYFPCLDAKSDVVLISVSYNFYLDMRSFPGACPLRRLWKPKPQKSLPLS